MTEYTYTGDSDIEHGGMFLDLDTFKEYGDYCPAVVVTNLDSAIGFEGAFLIERGVICCDYVFKKAAFETCGYENRNDLTPIEIVGAFHAYGGIERDSIGGEVSIQTLEGGALHFENWQVDKDESKRYKESGLSLFEYIQENFL